MTFSGIKIHDFESTRSDLSNGGNPSSLRQIAFEKIQVKVGLSSVRLLKNDPFLTDSSTPGTNFSIFRDWINGFRRKISRSFEWLWFQDDAS